MNNQDFKLDEETSDLWQQGVKDFVAKGGFSKRTFENKKTQYVEPSIDLELTSLEDVYKYPETEYLIPPLLMRGSVNLIAAGPGKIKTTLSQSIAFSLLTGIPLWGKYPITETGPVLIVDEETPRSLLKDHMTRMGFNKDLPLYFLHFQDIRLDIDAIFEALMWKIVEVNPILIIFDSLVRLHGQKENDSIAMSTVMAKFRKIANCGPTIWVVHHHKKGEGPLDEKARGASDIIAGVDIEYRLVQKDGFYYLSSGKSRIEQFGPIKLKAEFTDTKIEITCEGTEREDILDEILEILDGEPLKAGEIHEKLKDRGIEVGINRVRNILKSFPGITGTKISRRGGGMLYSLNQVSPLEGKFHSSLSYKERVKELNLNLNLHGQPENSHIPREAIALDSQGLAEVSLAENEGGSEAMKLDLEVSLAGEKNQEDSETSEGDDSIREPGEEG